MPIDQVDPGRGARNRADYLTAVNGLPYGGNPAYGFQDGREFKLPASRIALTLPVGHAVSASDGKLLVIGQGTMAELTEEWLRRPGLTGAVEEIFGRMGGVNHLAVQSGSIGDFDIRYAPGRGAGDGGPVDIDVVAYMPRGERRVYSLVTIAPAGAGMGPFRQMVESLRRIPPGETIDARPLRVKVVRVQPGDTVDRLAAQMPLPDRAVEQFLLINGLDRGAVLRPGESVKTLTR